jgi:transposase-like protein
MHTIRENFWGCPQKMLTALLMSLILLMYTIFGAVLVAVHFLLSAKARTLSLASVLRMSEEEAHARFCEIRWSENGGAPFCPHCGGTEIYVYATRRIFRCKACRKQFSVTSGTLFHSRKLPISQYLAAIAIFVNAVKGVSALQLGRDLDVAYMTAFVLSHKLREAMASEVQAAGELAGIVEIDGAYVGGHVRQENRKEDRTDRRQPNVKRKVVAIARERQGRVIPWVVGRESEAVPMIRARVASGSVIHADESGAWDRLIAAYDMRRVNHSVEFMGADGACTNQAESYFARLRRAEFGQYHHISGHTGQYANETAWRENNRRRSNGDNWRGVTHAALNNPKSASWCGYWQRSAA